MKKAIRLIAVALVLFTLTSAFAACAAKPASNPDKALKALQDADYIALKDSGMLKSALEAAGIKGFKSVVSGTKLSGNTLNTVTILYFSDKDAANSVWDAVQKYSDSEKKEDSVWVVKKSGSMIYFGTKDGVKAAS